MIGRLKQRQSCILSSSVSTNSVDIDNPVPREGDLEKVSRQIKKTCL